MANQNDHQEKNEGIISYQKLRTFIGIIGLLLPFVVVLGSMIFDGKEFHWQPSISHYYYSKMHIVFVCTLAVLGGFLITYTGKSKKPWESRVSNFAGYCAFSIAAFPTSSADYIPDENAANHYLRLFPTVSDTMKYIHFTSAALLFGCFVVFCLVFFQQPDREYKGEELQKFNRRKTLYKVCGWGIFTSMLAMFIFFLISKINGHDPWIYSTFFFETTSLLFFGIAWLVKGSVIWKNYPVLRRVIKPLR